MGYFTHAMRDDVANLVGGDAALVFGRISHWIDADTQADNGHEHGGIRYVKIELKALAERFSWLSYDAVKRNVKKLRNAGLIVAPTDADGKDIRLGDNRYSSAKWFAIGPALPEMRNRPHMETKSPAYGDEIARPIRNNTPSLTLLSNAPSAREGVSDRTSSSGKPLQDDRSSPAEAGSSQAQLARQALKRISEAAGDALPPCRLSPTADLMALGRLLRGGNDPGVVAEAVAAFYASDGIRDQDARFKPMLQTALSQRRWEPFVGAAPPESPRAAYDAVIEEQRAEQSRDVAAYLAEKAMLDAERDGCLS